MSVTIYVWDLLPEASKEDITTFFNYCGKIKSYKELNLKKDEVTTRVVEIVFEDENAIQLALLLQGAPLEGKPISISETFVCISEYIN